MTPRQKRRIRWLWLQAALIGLASTYFDGRGFGPVFFTGIIVQASTSFVWIYAMEGK